MRVHPLRYWKQIKTEDILRNAISLSEVEICARITMYARLFVLQKQTAEADAYTDFRLP